MAAPPGPGPSWGADPPPAGRCEVEGGRGGRGAGGLSARPPSRCPGPRLLMGCSSASVPWPSTAVPCSRRHLGTAGLSQPGLSGAPSGRPGHSGGHGRFCLWPRRRLRVLLEVWTLELEPTKAVSIARGPRPKGLLLPPHPGFVHLAPQPDQARGCGDGACGETCPLGHLCAPAANPGLGPRSLWRPVLLRVSAASLVPQRRRAVLATVK